MATKIQRLRTRRDTTANWVASNPILGLGERGIEIVADGPDLEKVGDGSTAWNDLDYFGWGSPENEARLVSLEEEGADLLEVLGQKVDTDDVPDVMAMTERDWKMKNQRALRHFHVAATRADTTAVDIFFGPSDSIGEGAYASAWNEMYHNVARDKIRRALQPANVRGGPGYWGFGSNLAAADSPLGSGGSVGTITTINTAGLGRKAWVLAPGAALVLMLRKATAYQIVYSTNTGSGGAFTTALGSPPGTPTAAVVTDAGSVTRGNKSPVYACQAQVAQYLTITNTGTVDITLEGLIQLYDDATVGIRTWEGAHSGYTAFAFQQVPAWADSLKIMPNPRLVVMGIGSNDWYIGRTVAQTKADILANIALMRSKIGHSNFSIVLVMYYTREATAHPSSVAPWSDFQKMYKEIAAADPNIALFDIEPLFGIQQNATDTLDGLLYTDYLHPTSAGFLRLGGAIADFVIPDGTEGAGRAIQPYMPEDMPVSAPQQAAIEAGRAGINYTPSTLAAGTVNYSLFSWGVPGTYPLIDAVGHHTLTGAVVFNTSTFPAAGTRPGHFWADVVQDATGGRSVSFVGFKYVDGIAPIVDAAPGARSLLHFFYDGTQWWVDGGPVAKGYQAPVIGITGVTGATNFSTFLQMQNFRLVLSGAASLSAAVMPAVPVGISRTMRITWVQDATGGRVLTHTGFKRPGGSGPVLSTAPNAQDVLEYYWDGAAWWVYPLAMNGS